MNQVPMSHTEYALIAAIASKRGVSLEAAVKQLLTEAIVSRIARSLTQPRIALVVPFRRRYEA